MRVPATIEQLTWPTLRKIYEQVARVINGGLDFGDGVLNNGNHAIAYGNVTPALAATDFTITHELKRIPTGYFVVEKSAPCDVYTGSVTATASQITLRASVGGVTLRIMVF